MKICPSCGSELDDDLSFCPADGSPLLDQEDPGEADAGIGDETVVMGSDEPAEEAPDEGVGDATVVMGDVTKDEIETVISCVAPFAA